MEDELKLELSSEKTLITHARAERARFLGYEIQTWIANDTISTEGKRDVNGKIGLYVPKDVMVNKRSQYMRKGKPMHRPELLEDSDYSIIRKYQMEYQGLVQYYMLASNVSQLGKNVHYPMRTSLVKTLAAKYRTKATTMLAKYRATRETAYGTMNCLRVEVPRKDGKPPLVATFGGIPLRRKRTALLNDSPPTTRESWRITDIVKRMLADKCERCGAQHHCEVHHIRKLADLHKEGRREKPDWMKKMITMRRKTLVVCASCHDDIHAGRPLQRGI